MIDCKASVSRETKTKMLWLIDWLEMPTAAQRKTTAVTCDNYFLESAVCLLIREACSSNNTTLRFATSEPFYTANPFSFLCLRQCPFLLAGTITIILIPSCQFTERSNAEVTGSIHCAKLKRISTASASFTLPLVLYSVHLLIGGSKTTVSVTQNKTKSISHPCRTRGSPLTTQSRKTLTVYPNTLTL